MTRPRLKRLTEAETSATWSEATRMTGKRHQIRLSGDPQFQDCLRRARSNLCRLQISAQGTLGDVAAVSVMCLPAEEILQKHEEGCCPAKAPHATSPDPTSLEVCGAAAAALAQLRAELLALGGHKLNLRSIVHVAICVLAEKNEAFLVKASKSLQRADRKTSATV